MAIENRSIRIEDWQGNTYYPESSSSNSTAGQITDSSAASSDPDSDTYTDGTKIADPTANGSTAIYIVSDPNVELKVFTTTYSNIQFGNINVNIRLKSSIGEGSEELLRLDTYFIDTNESNPVETLLQSTAITGTMIGKVNEYVSLSLSSPYAGNASSTSGLKIVLTILPGTGCSLYLDNMAVGLETAPGTMIFVEGSTIIVK